MPSNINYFNDNPDRVLVNAQIIRDVSDLGELAVASDEAQNDLLYIKFLLVSSGKNNNNDYFTVKDMLRSYKTPRDKHINWEHNHEKIIGHIKNSIITYNGTVLADSEIDKFLSMDEPPNGQYDIYCSGVIYKSACSPFARRVIEAFGKNKGDYGYLSVSMEVLFKEWYYLVGDQVYDKEFAYQFAPLHKVKKKFEGSDVLRVFKNYYFSGCGVVPKPGNNRSEILAIASEISQEIDDVDAISIFKDMSPTRLNDQELFFEHSSVHRLYDIFSTQGKVEGWTKKDIINHHLLVTTEMSKRNFDHIIDGKLDKDTKRFMYGANANLDVTLSTIKAKILSDLPEDIVVEGGIIKVIGSFLDEGDDFSALDVHCDLRLDIVNALKSNINIGKDVNIIESLSRPTGNYSPLYQLVLRKNPDYNLILSDYKHRPMDKNIQFYSVNNYVSDIYSAQSKFPLNEDVLILPCYDTAYANVQIHKDDAGNVIMFSSDGRLWDEEAADDIIRQCIMQLKNSQTGAFILFGHLTNSCVYIYDCLLGKEEDLSDFSALSRFKIAESIVNSIGYDRTSGQFVKMSDYIVSKQCLISENIIAMYDREFTKMTLKGVGSSYSEDGNNYCWNFDLTKEVPVPEEESATATMYEDDETNTEVVVNIDQSCDSYLEAFAADVSESAFNIPVGYTGKYVVQQHKRGKSVHTDLRLEHPGGDLIGWTLDTPGNEKSRNKILKHNPADRVLAQQKSEHPHSWLTFEGKTEAGEDSKNNKPGAGATKNHPGEFKIVDKGTFIAGASKNEFHEYFLKSEETGTMTGRWVVRKIRLKANSLDSKSPTTKKVAAWLLWKPSDQTPYGDQKDSEMTENQKKAWEKARKKVLKMLGQKENFSMDFAVASYVEDDEQWIIEGYAATNDLGRGNRVITADGLQSAMQGLKGVPLYKNHDRKDEVGMVLDAALLPARDENESTKIWVKCLISKTRPDIWQEVKETVLRFFSIGGKATKYYWDINDQNERLQLIIQFGSLEVSLTGIPENPKAEIIQWYTSSVEDEEEDEAMAEEIRDNETEETAAATDQATETETAAASEETQPQSAETETQEAQAGTDAATVEEGTAGEVAPETQTQETASAGAEESTETTNWEAKYNDLFTQFNEVNTKLQDRLTQDLVNSRLQECVELGLEFSPEKTEELTGRFKQMDEAAYDAWTTDLLELKQAIAALPKEVSDLMDECKKEHPDWTQGKMMKESWKKYRKMAKASDAASVTETVTDPLTALGGPENTAEASSEADPASMLDNVQAQAAGLPNIETEIKSGSKYAGFWG